MTRLCG